MVSVVIAAWNEEKAIGKVLRELKKAGYKDIIVVDDGSSDTTLEAAEKEGATVLRHLINRGQGAALKTGIDHAVSEGADIIVTYDADGQFVASEIKDLIRPIKEGKADIVLGSRFLGSTKNMPLSKRLILKLGVIFVWMLYRINVTDSQNGLRAMTREAAKKILITSDRMEHAGEILHEIKRTKLKYMEIPVTVIYTDYAIAKGQSWSRSISLGLRMLLRKMIR